jgi:hypothetical protein
MTGIHGAAIDIIYERRQIISANEAQCRLNLLEDMEGSTPVKSSGPNVKISLT